MIGAETVAQLTQQILEKLHCSLSKITNSIRMLVYGFLDANKGLRSVFRGDKHFKKFPEIPKFY